MNNNKLNIISYHMEFHWKIQINLRWHRADKFSKMSCQKWDPTRFSDYTTLVKIIFNWKPIGYLALIHIFN